MRQKMDNGAWNLLLETLSGDAADIANAIRNSVKGDKNASLDHTLEIVDIIQKDKKTLYEIKTSWIDDDPCNTVYESFNDIVDIPSEFGNTRKYTLKCGCGSLINNVKMDRPPVESDIIRVSGKCENCGRENPAAFYSEIQA